MAVCQSSALLTPGGLIASRLPGYEERPQQTAMAAAVERAFADNRHLIAEAGTGVGKSFAYLIPAILKATSGQRGDKPVVISTGTIALQEQLTGKDIPFLRSVWDREFTAVLAKGRGNYASLRRLSLAHDRARQDAKQSNLLGGDGLLGELDKLTEWSRVTDDGSLASMDFKPSHEAWTQAVSDSNNCKGKGCPTYETCFYQRARRRLYNAHILVVNHHLLFADLALKMNEVSYLPDYEYLIIDEAHEAEKAASEHLGIRLARAQAAFFLNSIKHERTGRGLTATYRRIEPVLKLVARARLLADAFFDDTYRALMGQQESQLRLREGGRFTTDAPAAFRDVYLYLNEAARTATDEDEQLELAAAARRALSIGDTIEEFVTQSLPDQVYWLEQGEGRRGDNVELRAAPIHVGELLRKHLFSEMRSVILTSATLATGVARRNASDARSTVGAAFMPPNTKQDGRKEGAINRAPTRGGPFGYIRDRLGLGPSEPGDRLLPDGEPDDADVGGTGQDGEGSAAAKDSGARELLLDSPFDYARQAVIRLPDMPEPGTDGYDEALAREVIRGVKASPGGSFVLFTSYTQMRRTFDAVQAQLTFGGYTLLVQGEGLPRGKMLELFKAGKRMVLFGTETFWQGVDVPGEALTGVIITRLPFAVPSEPLTAARMEAIDRHSGNSFMEFSLPQAIIKLKQGFGRLIRRTDDYGTVTILDSRIRRKPYGKHFINALPPARVEME